jgi:hypothetical protein
MLPGQVRTTGQDVQEDHNVSVAGARLSVAHSSVASRRAGAQLWGCQRNGPYWAPISPR